MPHLYKLILILIFQYNFAYSLAFYCNSCGNDLRRQPEKNMDSFSIGAISSPLAVTQTNKTIDKVTYFIQEFINPANIRFKVVQFNKDDILVVEHNKESDPVLEHSWFPGYGWKIAVCKHCRAFLGWIFEPSTLTQYFVADDRHFVGVIFDRISLSKVDVEKFGENDRVNRPVGERRY